MEKRLFGLFSGKRADFSVQTIVVIVICLLVLIVVIFIFKDQIGYVASKFKLIGTDATKDDNKIGGLDKVLNPDSNTKTDTNKNGNKDNTATKS